MIASQWSELAVHDTVLTKVQEDMRKYADRHRGEAVEYKIGDLVLLSTKDLK